MKLWGHLIFKIMLSIPIYKFYRIKGILYTPLPLDFPEVSVIDSWVGLLCIYINISGQKREPHIWRRSRHRGRGQIIENDATDYQGVTEEEVSMDQSEG